MPLYADTFFCAVFAVVLIVSFTVWIVRGGNANDRHKRAALSNRFCVACGYNVYACGSDRCPECGTPIPHTCPLPPPRKPL